MADAELDDIDLRPYARIAPWHPVTANRELFTTWLFYRGLSEIDRSHQTQLYFATALDNFPIRVELGSREELLFFDRMGVDKWNSFCGRVDDTRGTALAFVAGSDLRSIGAQLEPQPGEIDLALLHGEPRRQGAAPLRRFGPRDDPA